MTMLCDWEIKVLMAFSDGTVDDLPQGAALNAAAETLISHGYMTRTGTPTRLGKLAITALPPAEQAGGSGPDGSP